MFQFTAFIRKKWSEYSQSSGQRGTMIDELAVKPTGLVLGDFYNTLVKQRRVNDITNWKDMTEDEMDFFGNKFFMPRVVGDYSYGMARIWFDQKKDILLTSSSLFSSIGGLQYRPIQLGVVNSGSFVKSTDRFALYYVDIPIIAVSKGDAYNLNPGELNQLSGVNFSYKMVSNVEYIRNGLASESNEQYYNRLLYTVNDRSMMNKRSAFARLPEFFPTIRSMYISAPGDRYMQRDLVEAVDISEPKGSVDFLGKTQGENMVKSIAFYQIFPYEAGNVNGSKWNPFSSPTTYQYPITIEPIDMLSTEPAYHGYALNQECEDDKYKGLFFDDLKTYMGIRTNDLFNIDDEQVSINPVVVPSSDWIYGAHGLQKGSFGPLADGAKDSDIIQFVTNQIKVSGGAVNSISVGKDIKKRIGIKMSGSFEWPTVASDSSLTANSNLQIMVGGINSDTVEGYTGIGFGVRVRSAYVYPDTDPSLPTNASLYFAHCERYGDAQVYATSEDLTDHISVGDIGALAEKQFRVEPGQEYEFEFIIYDDLRMTLYLNKVANRISLDPNGIENNVYFRLPSTVLKVYSTELLKQDTTETSHYGTTMKVTLDTQSQDITDTWTIDNLKAFDVSEKRATAMFALNVGALEDPLTLYMRSSGSSAVDGVQSDGYLVYIWDREAKNAYSGNSELTSGGWTELPEISNPDGSRDATAGLFSTTIDNADRYRVQNRFGNNIFILVTTSGTTRAKSRFSGESEDDVHSILHVDYIKVDSGNVMLYHANNKADYHVTTISNQESLGIVTTVATKQSNESFFELSLDTGFSMPIAEIISISIGSTVSDTQILSQSDYTVVVNNPLLSRSSREKLNVYLNGYNPETITVQYAQYPDIKQIQDFFDGQSFGKVFGNILIRHKNPINLSFTLYYTGAANDGQLTDSIKQYFDQNIDGTFVVKDFVSFLYNSKLVNNVKEPISFNYTRYDSNGNLVSGTFTDRIDATDIEYFQIQSLTVSAL
jgi:hypothetical protein